ncbi:MAG: 16S rRNA (guanine(966)-N(2))-methyltransferase RsmD [Clostridiales bacterium]|nr:16S rRNA (guanine(966)-N(2))-methyltransferase RsmD [Clostridiales bacterium]
MKPNLVLTGGEHRSRRLFAPEGRDTRPTRAIVREALFNMLQGAAEGARVLDLFAGSGALGFEALSRGALQVTFCDHAADAQAVLRKNAALLKAQESCAFLRLDWRRALEELAQTGQRFDLILLDPPYGMEKGQVLAAILARQTLAGGGTLALEQGSREKLELPPGLEILRSRRYGESAVTLITLSSEDPI